MARGVPGQDDGDSIDSLAYIQGRSEVLNREQIIARLRENEAALREQGVVHAAVFGSRARGDAKPESDTDIMIEIDPAAPVG